MFRDQESNQLFCRNSKSCELPDIDQNMPPSKVADIDMSNGETTDNPYLSVIFRKQRSLKKK